jgi:hypothetical protein
VTEIKGVIVKFEVSKIIPGCIKKEVAVNDPNTIPYFVKV